MNIPITEESKFSEHLKGKDGLESVHGRIIAETKLLEQMEIYIEKRAALDFEYGEKLAKLHEKVKIGDTDPHIEGSQIEKAWRTYMTESENKAITIMNMTKMLNTTQQKIKTLKTRKKEVAEQLNKNKQKLEFEFSRNEDDMERLKNIYQMALKEAAKLKERLDETYKKSKGAKEWPKIKEKFDHVSRKLHMNHNEYFLAIHGVNEHLKHKMNELTPHVLDSYHDLQKQFVPPWKDIFLDLITNSSWARPEFINSEEELKQSIELVNPTTEFINFLVNFQKQGPLIPFMFDASLTKDENATSGLTSEFLAINDLTHAQLFNKKKTYEDEEVALAKNFEMKEKEFQEQTGVRDTMNNSETNNAIFSTIDQAALCHSVQLELKEITCKRDMNKLQHSIVEHALSEVENPTRPYIELFPPSSHTLSGSTPNVTDAATLKQERKNRSSTMPKIPNILSRRNSTKNSPVHNEKRARSLSLNSNDSSASYDQPEEGSLDVWEWFHGKINRQTVQQLLRNDGDFIVREKSDNSGEIVLSVLWCGQPKHFILREENGKYKLEGESFPTIPQLITYHHEKRSIIQSSTGVILLTPIRVLFRPGSKYIHKHTDVRLEQKLGSGHFGDVYRGTLKKHMQVAVKTLKERPDMPPNQKQKFLEEAEIMKNCQHKNIVEFIGICNETDPCYILLELCEKGDLLNLLRTEAVRLDNRRFIQMADDIAAGMAFLEQKQIIHRDLAARNCLVKRDYTVKICDFGMSREEDDDGVYKLNETKVIPFKWCAPEVWLYSRYTSKTDVWSYGVVLWEIFSGGKQPYAGWNNMEARTQVETGYRLPSPSGTPPDMYTLMLSCWEVLDQVRPTFQEIYQTVQSMPR